MTNPELYKAIALAKEQLNGHHEHWADDDWQYIVCEAAVELCEVNEEMAKFIKEAATAIDAALLRAK